MRKASSSNGRRVTPWLVAVVIAATAATSFADPNPDDRWRWETSVGGCFASLSLRGEDLGGGGLCGHVGRRAHKFAVMASYSHLWIDWTPDSATAALGNPPPQADGDVAGTLQRFGVAARYNVLTLGSSPTGDLPEFHEFFELFVEAGAGLQVIDWNGGGRLMRGDVALGGGIRLYGIRISDHRSLGLLAQFVDAISRRPGPAPTMPTCAGPCDSATIPGHADQGVLGMISLVVSE